MTAPRPIRGGARPGAGRKSATDQGAGVLLSLRLPPDAAALVKRLPGPVRARWLANAIQAYHEAAGGAPGPRYDLSPAVADVSNYMSQHGVAQDEAVRALGGIP